MAHDVSDLLVVHATLHNGDQGRRETDSFERLQRLLAYSRQLRAAEVDQRIVIQ